MEKTIKHHSDYLSNEDKTWKSRFTWKGLSGKDPKHTISIMNFASSTDAFKDIKHPNNTSELFSLVNELSDKYVSWVKTKGKDYSKSEYADMKSFFIGAIGEYFAYKLLTEVKCLMVAEEGNFNFKRFDFNYVSPTLSTEADNGIDLYCVANDKPCVMQVKFWSPYKKEKVEPVIFQKMLSEGLINRYIDLDHDDNTILFWLGNENSARMSINKDKEKLKHAVIIGRQTLDASINGRNQVFWDGFYKSLENI